MGSQTISPDNLSIETMCIFKKKNKKEAKTKKKLVNQTSFILKKTNKKYLKLRKKSRNDIKQPFSK